MTETCGPAVQSSPDEDRDLLLTTVGRPLPGVEVDVVEPGTDSRVPVGDEGEIRFRGWGVMDGYQDDPETTAEALNSDGWMRSGDLGTVDARGYVRVTGRLKDTIIRGGENIAPATVEEELRVHIPEIFDVNVVGAPDDYYGEVVTAFVRLTKGAQLSSNEFLRRLEGQMPKFRIPAHVRFVDEFPTTASGKIQKFELRRRIADEVREGATTTGLPNLESQSAS